MKRGLVIGKFLPIHNGHIALIEFACRHCDELIVSMSRRVDDPIDPALRLSWIREIFKNNFLIRVEMIDDDFDDESLPWEERTRIWSAVISKAYPRIDVVVSSEEYGEHFARNLGAANIVFDPARNHVPVSATRIRSATFTHWEYIPEVVRPYFVKKICFYGPECTGKSLMAERMASLFQTEFVPEVAREFLSENVFTDKDIVDIGLAHLQRIHEKTRVANKVLFCDTDAITTQVYSRHYLGIIPPVLYGLEKMIAYDHYFLFDIDVPWVPDGLRDLGHLRKEMLTIFQDELNKRGIAYTLVCGDWAIRERIVLEKILSLFPDLRVP